MVFMGRTGTLHVTQLLCCMGGKLKFLWSRKRRKIVDIKNYVCISID